MLEFMRGSSHIGDVVIGLEYRNCCQTLDVYSDTFYYLDGGNSIKTLIYIFVAYGLASQFYFNLSK